MHKCTYVFKLFYKEEPDDGSCEPKHILINDFNKEHTNSLRMI
jgi:hypothetical protein